MSISLPCADARRGLVPSGTRRSAASPRLYPGSPPRAVTAPLSPRVAHARFEPRLLSCPHLPPGSPLCAATARYRLAASTPRSEPRLPSARSHIALLPSIPRPSRPCADARRGLVPSGTRRAVSCPRLAPGSPPRAVTARYRLASPSPRSEPRFPSARTLRGSALPAPDPSTLPTGWARCSPSSLSPPLSFCRMGCRPRSRGACGQTESPVRSGTPPTGARQRGGGRRVPRRPGERRVPPVRPSCGACEISRLRQPGPPART